MDAAFFGLAATYLLTVMGDGCIIIAASLAASSGGRPVLWALGFGMAHTLFCLVGLVIAGQAAEYSHLASLAFAIAAICILIRHFIHHHKEHTVNGSCSCSDPKHETSLSFILGSSFGLSIHAIAGGAVLNQVFINQPSVLIICLSILSGISVGTVIGLVVYAGQRNSDRFLKFMDYAPGITTAALTALMCYAVHSFIIEIFPLSGVSSAWLFVMYVAITLSAGYWMHDSRQTTHSGRSQITH